MPDRPARYDSWQWHRAAADGRSAVEKEFKGLPDDVQARLKQRMDKFVRGTSSPREIDHLGDGLYEIRVKIGSNPFRLLFFCDGTTPVALTAVKKKDQQTPKQILDRAKARRASWGGSGAKV